jgi:hypothetical protein
VAQWTLCVQPTCTPRVRACARSVPSWAFPGPLWVINFARPASPCVAAEVHCAVVWRNYHETWCRYRRLQVEVIRQIQEELDPDTRSAREEALVDNDQLFDSVCPQCKEPITDDQELDKVFGA